MLHLIGFIITGFIVGLVARALLPGRQDLSLTKTTLLGIVGSFLAGWLGRAAGWYGPDDGTGFIASTIGAIILLLIYTRATRRSSVESSDKNYPRRVA